MRKEIAFIRGIILRQFAFNHESFALNKWRKREIEKSPPIKNDSLIRRKNEKERIVLRRFRSILLLFINNICFKEILNSVSKTLQIVGHFNQNI